MSYEKLGFQKGQLLKADHLNHIEDGIASMDCDWNIMKNKPFGEEKEIINYYLEPVTITQYHAVMYGSLLNLTEGDWVTVNVNDIEYEMYVHINEEYGSHYGYFGDNGEHEFYISEYGTEAGINMATEGEYTISIYTKSVDYVRLDPKYLPEALQFGEETIKDVECSCTVLKSSKHEYDSIGFEVRQFISVDGVEYNIEDKHEVYLGENGGYYYYGNTALVDNESLTKLTESVDVPFCLVSTNLWSVGDESDYIYVLDDGKEHTVEIYNKYTTVKTIDEQYLPEVTKPFEAYNFYVDSSSDDNYIYVEAFGYEEYKVMGNLLAQSDIDYRYAMQQLELMDRATEERATPISWKHCYDYDTGEIWDEVTTIFGGEIKTFRTEAGYN